MDSIVPAEDIAPLDDDGAITAVPDEEPYPVPHLAAGSIYTVGSIGQL